MAAIVLKTLVHPGPINDCNQDGSFKLLKSCRGILIMEERNLTHDHFFNTSISLLYFVEQNKANFLRAH